MANECDLADHIQTTGPRTNFNVLIPEEEPEGDFHARRARLEEKCGRSVIASYTYFAQAVCSSFIKIGRSMEPEERAEYLSWQRGEPVIVLATLRGGKIEQAYHDMFYAHCIYGEWFHPHPDILAEIERINSAKPAPSSATQFRRVAGTGAEYIATTAERPAYGRREGVSDERAS